MFARSSLVESRRKTSFEAINKTSKYCMACVLLVFFIAPRPLLARGAEIETYVLVLEETQHLQLPEHTLR